MARMSGRPTAKLYITRVNVSGVIIGNAVSRLDIGRTDCDAIWKDYRGFDLTLIFVGAYGSQKIAAPKLRGLGYFLFGSGVTRAALGALAKMR